MTIPKIKSIDLVGTTIIHVDNKNEQEIETGVTEKGKVDLNDEVVIQETLLTTPLNTQSIKVKEFLTDAKFSRFGSPANRLKLLAGNVEVQRNNPENYKVISQSRLPIASPLKDYVNKQQKGHERLAFLNRRVSRLAEELKSIGRRLNETRQSIKELEIRAVIPAKELLSLIDKEKNRIIKDRGLSDKEFYKKIAEHNTVTGNLIAQNINLQRESKANLLKLLTKTADELHSTSLKLRTRYETFLTERSALQEGNHYIASLARMQTEGESLNPNETADYAAYARKVLGFTSEIIP